MVGSLMTSSRLLTPEDRALLAETSAPDLPQALDDQIVLVQSNSPELLVGDGKYVPGAVAGDFIIPVNNERILRKGQIGYPFQNIGGDHGYPEYQPNRGGFVTAHPEKPSDARWPEPK